MKKGLLSLLAVALTLVGCQNYDDQFADLNTKIANLQTSIAGLATVGADVAALKATVGGLATAAQTDALSSGLATAQADLDAIETALASVASASDLTAVKTQLSSVESDVKELLAANAVINQSITINSLPTLQYAESLVSTDPTDPNVIVNGNIVVTLSDTFLNTAGVDLARISAVTDKIATVLGTTSGGQLAVSGTYSTSTSPGALSFANLTFVDTDLNLTGTKFPTMDKLTTVTGSVTATVAGDVKLNNLAVTGSIQVGTGATSVDLTGSTATSIYTAGSAAGVLVLNSATTIDVGTALVTSLAANAATTINLGNTGSDNDLSVTASSVTTQIDIAAKKIDNLTIASVSSPTIINIKSATEIDDASVSGAGQLWLDAMTSLGTATISADIMNVPAWATNAGATTLSTVLDLQAAALSQTNSLTLTLAKTVKLKSTSGNVTVGGKSLVAPAIENLTISAQSKSASLSIDGDYDTLKVLDVTGAAADGDLDVNQLNGVEVVAGAAALTDITVGGKLSKFIVTSPAATLKNITTAGEIRLVSISGATGLENATIGHDHVEGMLGAEFTFNNNDKITALNADNLAEVRALNIVGNAKLAAISFNSITDPDGVAASLKVSVTDNALTADMVAATAATETKPAVPAAITNSSGLFDLKTYLGSFVASTALGTTSFELEIDVVNYKATASSDASTKTNTAAFAADNAAGNVTAGDDISTLEELALLGS